MTNIPLNRRDITMNKKPYLFAGLLLLTCHSYAWIAAGHAGGYHGGYHGGYYHGYYPYNSGWAAHGVVIGVPGGAYYGGGCRVIQSCNYSGCFNQRICD